MLPGLNPKDILAVGKAVENSARDLADVKALLCKLLETSQETNVLLGELIDTISPDK